MRSILDFIIYFMAPAVSLLSESGDGSGLKAITSHRRRKREALHRKSTASEKNQHFRDLRWYLQQVASVWGVGLGHLSSKRCCRHFSTKSTHGHKAGRVLLLRGGPLAVADNEERLDNAGAKFPSQCVEARAFWLHLAGVATGPESLGWGLLTKDPGGPHKKKHLKL